VLSRKCIRLSSILSTALMSTLLVSSLASAHVTVKPPVSAPEAWETYTMKVPTEKDLPTVKVTLKVPEQAQLEQYQPVPGWKTSIEKGSDGQAKTITWEAESGGGIEPGQFQQFSFVAKNPSAEGELDWDAFQYYSDGSVVEWTGAKGSDSPHSITQITKPSTEAGTGSADADQGHNASSTGSTEGSPAGAVNNAESSNSTMNTVTLVISILALLVSLAALWRTVRNRRSK
jgi:uncharacterized protein YcnI